MRARARRVSVHHLYRGRRKTPPVVRYRATAVIPVTASANLRVRLFVRFKGMLPRAHELGAGREESVKDHPVYGNVSEAPARTGIMTYRAYIMEN